MRPSAVFGSDCGVDDIQAVAKANELCNGYTLDTISTGATIAFAMECFEHGLIGLGGHRRHRPALRQRRSHAAAMIELIARREGIGDLLAEGSRHAAEKIGGEALYFAMQVKGQELPMHDPRGKVDVGLGYAISEIGADHLTAIHDTMVTNPEAIAFKGAQDLGISEPIPARELGVRKAGQYALFENWISFGKVSGFCFFRPGAASLLQVDEVMEAVRCGHRLGHDPGGSPADWRAGHQPGACISTSARGWYAPTTLCRNACSSRWRTARCKALGSTGRLLTTR